MRFVTSALTLILFSGFAVAVSPAAAQSKKVKPINLWSGKSRDNSGLKLAPKSSFISDTMTWKKLWTAWRGDDKLPEIDFMKHLVLVATVRGPNRIFASVTINNQGDARMLVGGTKIGGPGFGYAFLQVDREGIKSVNGNPISGSAAPKSAEYIKVEVRGKLNSRVFAIGGETTGVVISASGITWELDLGRNKVLRQLATELNQKQVVVTGELTVKRGVEIRQRTIVKVSSLKAAGDTTPK